MSLALIALGANLPGPGRSPLETCRHAAVQLDSLPQCGLAGLSRWFVTAPVPPSDQADYVNAVALLRIHGGALQDPAVLLAHLLSVEGRFGRTRNGPNAARTLDLDIIAMRGRAGPIVRSAPDPILPHPRAHQRAFVLAPWADVAPDWVHPTLCQPPALLMQRLSGQGIRPLS